MERPEDPISFLAFYMLKNKHKIKLPQPPTGNKDGNEQPNTNKQEEPKQ